MLVQGTSGAKTLGLLGASTNGGSQGTVTINYTDGTSTTQPVSFNDWASSPSSPDTAVATMSYRNSIGGLPDVSNTVANGTTAAHIFAVSLG